MCRFEIVYADNSMIQGRTGDQFRDAPRANIQFVIERTNEGGILVHKALDEYLYQGETKPGAWTTRVNYERIKATLPHISELI